MKSYSSNYRCNTGIITVLFTLLQQVITYQWQIRLSIKKKIHATYQQDVLSLFWAIFIPIVPMTVYMILAHIKVFKSVEDMPHIYYIAVGMFVWLIMATTIHALTESIKREKSILTTTNFPVFPVMISRLGEVLHDSTIRLIALAVIIILYNVDIAFTSYILAFIALIPAIIFALGLGMMLAILDVVVQDTRRIVTLMLRYGLFISSVIFPFPEWGIPGALNQFNIFNTYVNAIRDILFYGYIENLSLYLYTSVVAIVIFLVAAKLVYSMEFKVRAYL